MAPCPVVAVLKQAPRYRFLACGLHIAGRHALPAPAVLVHAAQQPHTARGGMTCQDVTFRRSVVTRAAVSSIDEFELDDEEPVERRQVLVGEEQWAKTVHAALMDFMNCPEAEELDVFLFRTSPDKRVEVRVDKLTDKYGSPTLGDLQTVAAAVNSRLLEQLGEEAAGEIEVAVSSPGAERPVEWDELERFSQLPLWVVFTDKDEAGESVTTTHVLEIIERKEGSAIWKLADVKANSPGKGRKMNKRMREQRWTLGDADVQGMRVYVDF